MAYDRYDRRDERPRWRDDDDRSERGWRGDDRGRRDERGFFERAGDEISSWFGDDEAERRRREDRMRDERERDFGPRGDYGRERDRDRFRDRGRDYRPMTGDYGRAHESDQFFAASGVGRGERGFGDYDREGDRSSTPWSRDEYRRTSRAGTSDWSDRSRHERDFDPHYRSWRERQMSELDRDYDEYRQENRSRFESDFGSWRERRQQKRGLLGQVREHMEVVGNDDQHVGTVDRVAGDRIILTKSDPESGGVHHSLSCSEIDRVEGDRVVLDCSAEQARNRWRDESRSRALFEREDQGEMGPRMLDRSFEGTYR
jgi:hypothetical protein